MMEFTINKKINGVAVGEKAQLGFTFDPRPVIKRLGKTNAYIAERLCISPSAVLQMINGNASVTTIAKLAYALDVDPREFFTSDNGEQDAKVHNVVKRDEITCPYCSKRFLLLD